MFYCQLSDRYGYHTKNRLSIDNLGDLAHFGPIPGRFTRGQATKYTAGSKCAIRTIWVFTVGVGVYTYFSIRPSSHSIMDSWECRCKY